MIVKSKKPTAPKVPQKFSKACRELYDGFGVACIIEIAEMWGVDPAKITVELDTEQDGYSSDNYAYAKAYAICTELPNKNYAAEMERYAADKKVYNKAIRAYNKRQKEKSLIEKRAQFEALKKELGE